jgi:PIN domain nuclease of toxin-antitoxin system
MKVLLDTHSFLWIVLNDAQLSATAGSLIADPDTDVDISIISSTRRSIATPCAECGEPSLDLLPSQELR